MSISDAYIARILSMVAEGKSVDQIATALHLSPKTIYNYLQEIYNAYGIPPGGEGNRMAIAVRIALAQDVISKNFPKESLPKFTDPELRVLKLTVQGLTTPAIAARLEISTGYVDLLLGRIFIKCGVNSRVELVIFAISNGLA